MTAAGRAAVVSVVVAALVLTGCRRESGEALGRLEVDGQAEVTQPDGAVRTVSGGRTLRAGDQVRVLDGTATLSLGQGRALELRRDSVVRLVLEDSPGGGTTPQGHLLAGDVLVLAADQLATVVAGDTEVDVTTGAARVSTGLAVTVSTYQGAAGVRTGGRAASVPALRQVSVPAPGLPSRATPLLFEAGHPWDRRYLGDAIELGNQLGSRSLGFSAQLSPGQGTAAFYRQILPGLAAQPFDESLLDPAMAPGQVLVGAAITLEGTRGAFADRWRSVFVFHQEGAPWGLVALDQGVDRAAVLATVDAAIARLPGLPASPAGPGAPGPTPGSPGGGQLAAPGPGVATPTTVPPAGGGAGTGGAGTGGAPTTATTTPPAGQGASPAPSPLPDRGPVGLGVPLVDDTLNAVIDTLSGLLRAISVP